MSLKQNTPAKKYKLGIFAPRSLINIIDIESALSDKTGSIEHVFTNDVVYGGLNVMKFCSQNGIPFSVCPTEGNSILKVNNCIIKDSDFVVIFDNGKSENTKNIIDQCNNLKKKYKIFEFTGVNDIQKISAIAENIIFQIKDCSLKQEDGQKVDFSNLLKTCEKLKKVINGNINNS